MPSSTYKKLGNQLATQPLKPAEKPPLRPLPEGTTPSPAVEDVAQNPGPRPTDPGLGLMNDPDEFKEPDLGEEVLDPVATYRHDFWDRYGAWDTEGAKQDLANLKQQQTDKAAAAMGEAMAAQGGGIAGGGAITSNLYDQAGRDLAVEQEMLRRRQLSEMGRVAELLFQDRWKQLGHEHRMGMADLMLKNKKRLAELINARMEGGVDSSTAFDIWNTTVNTVADFLGG